MSGDVQPRKRKDKKRKKDDVLEQQQSTPTFIPHIQKTEVVDETNIHIHKEGGTGGGVCAKIVFFLLFSALAVLIGLIITEHRGITDVETSDSRFSEIFEGWTETLNHLDSEHLSNKDDDLDEQTYENSDEHAEEEEIDQDDNDQSNEQEENSQSNEQEENDQSNDEEEEENDQSNEEEEEEENDQSQEVTQEASDEDQQNESNEDDHASEYEEIEDNDNLDSNENANESGEQEEDSRENYATSPAEEIEAQQLNDIKNKFSNENDIDESDENNNNDDDDDDERDDTKHKTEQTTKKNQKDDDDEDINETYETMEEGDTTETSNMPIKFGVGAAILVVAYTVLVRKWRSAESTKDTEVSNDLTRRNTIVVPRQLIDLEQEGEDSDEASESEREDDMEDSDSKINEEKYRELRKTYSHSLNLEEQEEGDYYVGDEYMEESDDDNVEDESEQVESENEEDDEDNGDVIVDDDDEELLERLEAKYGKLTSDNKSKEISSEKYHNLNQASDKFSQITTENEWNVKDQLDEGQQAIEDNPAYALKIFESLLEKYPTSPRILYGKAQALDKLAEKNRSNEILQQAISVYLQILEIPNVPDMLFTQTADRCINRLRFLGNYRKAITINKIIVRRFPGNATYRNQLAVSYLTINKISEAKNLLNETLLMWPTNGFALVHYGFILKTHDNDLEKAVIYMKKGIATKEDGVVDGRFYFHLGDALMRMGKHNEANQLYEEGVRYGLFLSKYQRSLYNVAHLTGRPWWRIEDTSYKHLANLLKNNYNNIYKEGLSVLTKEGYFKDESENLKDKGEWKQFELFARGIKNVENCKKCPITCSVIEKFPEARDCKRGQTKFSVIHPGTHVWPHCGPTNCRLRMHLGIKVPPNTFIRVANETRSWKEGEIILFDDSFEHEVWHNGTHLRLVLIIDVWHPELTLSERKSLSPI